MFRPGDVVRAPLTGAAATKWRPTVVISTTLYQSTRADLIVALLTTQLGEATAPTDYILQDWGAANLRQPTAFRLYVNTVLARRVKMMGHLSDRDWSEVQARLRIGIAT